MLMHFYGFSKKEIDKMSVWYVDRFLENISNIEGWKNGGKLQMMSMVEILVEDQGINKESY